MQRAMILLVVGMIMFLSLAGCEEKQPTLKETIAPQKPADILFQDVMKPILTELPTEALAYWRSADEKSKPLVLFSMHPFLTAIPDEMQGRAKALAAAGSVKALKRHGSINRIDPVILSHQAVSAAITAGLVERILWVFPFKEKVVQLDLTHFREQIIHSGFLSKEEAARLTLKEGVFHGTVRNIPLLIAHPDADLHADDEISTFPQQPIIHLDLSYFRGLYTDAIKTPVYKNLLDAALLLRKMAWQPHVVTVTPRTEEGEMSLDARFLVHDFASLMQQPALLSQAMPQIWANRSETLRLNALLQNSAAAKLTSSSAELAPQEPTVVYDLYNLKMREGKTAEALELLSQAVRLEPGYAVGYLELADYFASKQQFELAEEMLQKAIAYYPDNIIIKVSLAQTYLNSNNIEQAQRLLEQLLKESWSSTYHGNAMPNLKKMAQYCDGQLRQSP